MKRFYSLLLCLVLIVALTACGGKSASPGAYDGMSPEAPSTDYGWYREDADNLSPGAIDQKTAKMIFTAAIDLETMEFDKAMEDINTLVDDASGYFEERNISGFSSGYRHASLIIRIPSAKFNAFCTHMGDICHTIRLNTSQENVSESYYDVESRLTTAKTKLDRLQELLSKADNMADIITLEDAISETEQTIDRLSGTLRGYYNLVDYATVNVTLDEVYRYSGTKEAPQTLGERLGNAFSSGLESVGDFFEGLAVFLAYSWLWLLMLAAIVVVVIVLVRRGNKRHLAKKAKSVENSRPE